MAEWSEADRYMLDGIRRGSGEAWAQLVERYQGRLIAFARHRAPRGVDAEDLVQDTFLLFLRGLNNYREQANLETFLFVILHRRLADAYRVKRIRVCDLPETDGPSGADSLAGTDPTASWYVRRDEQRDAARAALTTALQSLVQKMHESADLRDLQIIELLFYAQWPNRRIAAELKVDAATIAMLKHRSLKQLHERVAPLLQDQSGKMIPWETPDAIDSLLTEIWEEQRPSCPKRSTIGGFVLGTLETPWQEYVGFHLHQMKCSFCVANLQDLQAQTQQDSGKLRHRILQSTVGFFRKA